MEKYEKMLIKKREKNEELEKKAIKTIKQMLESEEQVVVAALVKKTGLSRSFFYNNKNVHEELRRAQELQEGKSFHHAQNVVFDRAMEEEIKQLKKALQEKESEITKLKIENAKLKKLSEAKMTALIYKI